MREKVQKRTKKTVCLGEKGKKNLLEITKVFDSILSPCLSLSVQRKSVVGSDYIWSRQLRTTS